MSAPSADPFFGLGAALDACLRPLAFGSDDAWRAAIVERARAVIGTEGATASEAIVLARFADLLESALQTLDDLRGVRSVARDEALRPVRPQPLTGREREVAFLIAEGRSAKEIAGTLALSVHTVRRHTE
nr:helix-turn-helix transcriptional regulator [Gemmatimonadaceae bacterium]